MRVALACPYAWDLPGGVQGHVRELAARLRDRGHAVVVLTPALRPVASPGLTVVGRAVRVPYQGTVAPIAPSPAVLARVRRALARFGPDVVHAHEPLAPSVSMAATMAARCPVVATFHAHVERSRLFDAAAALVRPVWRRVAVRVGVSEAAASFVASRLGDGVRVIPNGVDVDRFAEAPPVHGLPPGRRLLWVGRLDPQKGFPVAVRAFGRLAAEFPDLSLVVAGDGRDRRELDRLGPSVRGRVVLLGTVAPGRLPGYHAAADVFLSPALGQESFGIVLVEAMAAGLPVVATDIAGYREVVTHGVDGLLVAPGDDEALAAAVRRLLADPALAGSLGRAGREGARVYSWDSVVERIEEVYREAVEGGRHPQARRGSDAR